MLSIILSVFLSISPTASSIPPVDIQSKQIVEDPNFQPLVDLINSRIKDNKASIKIQDGDYNGEFSLKFIQLIMNLSKYYKDQGFKVNIYHDDEPDIIIFSISKIVS
jgi:hypothetical protein